MADVAAIRREVGEIPKIIRRLVWGTEGQELVEYAVLVVLISLVSVVAVAGLGASVTAAFQTVALQFEQ